MQNLYERAAQTLTLPFWVCTRLDLNLSRGGGSVKHRKQVQDETPLGNRIGPSKHQAGALVVKLSYGVLLDFFCLDLGDRAGATS